MPDPISNRPAARPLPTDSTAVRPAEVQDTAATAPAVTPAAAAPDSAAVAERTGLAGIDHQVVDNLAAGGGPQTGGMLGFMASSAATARPRNLAADPTLARVMLGNGLVKRGARGEHVKVLQQGLLDLGYRLVGGADGAFGGQSKAAVEQFQRNNPPLGVDGIVGKNTLSKLQELAPPPGQRAQLYPEYDRMFQDGVLDVTMAVGYDEANWHEVAGRTIRHGLSDRGYSVVDVANMDAAELQKLGIQPESVKPGVTFFHKQIEEEGAEPVQSVVRYVWPNKDGPRARFADGMRESDAVVYCGHARYGTGPDFDEKESPAENFIIGVNSEAHRQGLVHEGYDAHMNSILEGQPNALETETFDPDKYQLWFFQGCTTEHYRDELRGIDFGKDSNSLDLMGSEEPLYWDNVGAGGLAFLDGIVGRKSEHEITSSVARAHEKAGVIWSDGFADNSFKPE